MFGSSQRMLVMIT